MFSLLSMWEYVRIMLLHLGQGNFVVGGGGGGGGGGPEERYR